MNDFVCFAETKSEPYWLVGHQLHEQISEAEFSRIELIASLINEQAVFS